MAITVVYRGNMIEYFSKLIDKLLEWSFQRAANKMSRRKNENN
jgi:hypothetical protein|tara:strand:- start:244 stop:372 length:129 start_codon:yes stop_codon:yes gene_type:complete